MTQKQAGVGIAFCLLFFILLLGCTSPTKNYVISDKNVSGDMIIQGDLNVGGELLVGNYDRHVQLAVLAVGNPAQLPTAIDVGTAGGYQFASAGGQQELHFQWEVPDDWNGDDVMIEIDWLPDSGNMTAPAAIRWVFECRFIAEGELITQGSINTQSVIHNTNTSQYKTVHSSVTYAWDDTNQPIVKQDHGFCRTYRDTSVANDFSGTVIATGFEVLYGSNAIPTSN